MNDIERDLRSLLRTRGDEIPQPDVVPHKVLRRARVRRATTAGLLSVVLLAAGVGGVGASRALLGAREWKPASPVERLVDVDRLSADMMPAGDVHVIAKGTSEKGDFTYLGWATEDSTLCVQVVVDGDALQTSCFPREPLFGPLYLSGSRGEGWEDRVVEGIVEPEVARLEAHMSSGVRIDVPIYPAPEGLSVDGRNFAVGFVPGAPTGELVAFDARGERLTSEPLPYIAEPDPDDPRLDEQIRKVTLAEGRHVGPNVRVSWLYRAWRMTDGGLCTELRLKRRGRAAFDEGQSQCLAGEEVNDLGKHTITAERWMWHSGMVFVVGFASDQVEGVAAGKAGGRPYSFDNADYRLLPLDAALGDDLTGFQFVVAWVPATGDAEIVALGSSDRRLGSALVDARAPNAKLDSGAEMSFEQCEEVGSQEIARLFRVFGSQPAKLAAALEAVLSSQVCSTVVEEAVEAEGVTVPLKRKEKQRD